MSKPTQIIIAENWEYMQMVPNVSGIGSTLASDCPLPIWMTPNTDCGLTTAQIAEKDIPDGVKYEIIDADKFEEYRDIGIGSTALLMVGAITNYDFDTKVSTYDMTKAKKIAHRKRRNRRYSQFAPKDDIVAKANQEADDQLEKAKSQISVEKDKALLEIRKEVVDLSINVAEKIIKKNISKDDNSSIIEESMQKLKNYEA